MVYPAFAQNTYQQVLPTDQGTLNVGLYTIPEDPLPGEITKLKIDFLNTKTNLIQEHIDYKISVSKDGENIFGPIPLTHTSVGSVTIPIEFLEKGTHEISIDVEGILFQPIPLEKVMFNVAVAQEQTTNGELPIDDKGGCLIATAAFGSELSPQVQQLRELRDNVVLNTKSGTAFMIAFNQFYYSFSPSVADLERENTLFKEGVKILITPLLSSLSILSLVEIDSEGEMLGYGISVILLNIGMYFALPVLLLIEISKFRRKF